MLDGIGKSGMGRLDAQRATLGKAVTSAPVGASLGEGRSAGIGGTIADLVSAGPPVDTDKVARVRAAIASGAYAVDPDKIAEAMIAHDLPK